MQKKFILRVTKSWRRNWTGTIKGNLGRDREKRSVVVMFPHQKRDGWEKMTVSKASFPYGYSVVSEL